MIINGKQALIGVLLLGAPIVFHGGMSVVAAVVTEEEKPYGYDVYLDGEFTAVETMQGDFEVIGVSIKKNSDGSPNTEIDVRLLPDVAVNVDEVLFRYGGTDYTPEKLAEKFKNELDQ